MLKRLSSFSRRLSPPFTVNLVFFRSLVVVVYCVGVEGIAPPSNPHTRMICRVPRFCDSLPIVVLLCMFVALSSCCQTPCIDNFLPWEVVPCESKNRAAIYELDPDGKAYGNVYELRKVRAEGGATFCVPSAVKSSTTLLQEDGTIFPQDRYVATHSFGGSGGVVARGTTVGWPLGSLV